MKRLTLIFVALVTYTLLASNHCKKDRTDNNGLPPATQEGKNTLGFLLNGEPWTPKGFNRTANLSIDYDETFQNGVFNIGAYRILSNQPEKRQRINIYGDYTQEPERIALPNPDKIGVIFKDDISGCDYITSDSDTRITSGYFEITKLDKVNRIFSAEFKIIIEKPGCDRLEIESGRFDMKY